MKITVLGAGLVGGPMAMDLAKENNFEVTVIDRSTEALAKIAAKSKVITKQADLSAAGAIKTAVADSDLVINAVPGFMGHRSLQEIIAAGKNVVDIAFFPEDPFSLDSEAKAQNVTAIFDCGVAPGMSNILAGRAHHLLDQTNTILIYVGGLPKLREWPYEYKAVFSPIDVIEEYTRPARYVENGLMVVRPALTDAELLSFPKIGTLESFNSDGLRSLADTLDVPNMKEKTLRYPGHIEKMAVLRETGFFSQEPIEINGVKISPLDFTSKLLFPKWKLQPGEVDVTVMQVIAEGMKDGKKVRYTWDLYDEYDPATDVHSMARTTGYTATVVARLLAAGEFNQKGIIAPELLGKDDQAFQFLLDGLAERGIIYQQTITELD
jgi:lysine 6-dehydrogenase